MQGSNDKITITSGCANDSLKKQRNLVIRINDDEASPQLTPNAKQFTGASSVPLRREPQIDDDMTVHFSPAKEAEKPRQPRPAPIEKSMIRPQELMIAMLLGFALGIGVALLIFKGAV